MNGVANTIITCCPTCNQMVTCPFVKDEHGMIHPLFPIPESQLFSHNKCDQEALHLAISRSAYHLSKVEVFRLHSD